MTDERAEKIRQRRLCSIGVGVFACFCLMMMCWKQASNAHAWWLYRHSRDYQYSGRRSFDFLSFGVSAGDTELIVDQKLAAMGSASVPGRASASKFYSFTYGHDFFIQSAGPVLTEWITVYFDEDGKADKIIYHLSGDGESDEYMLNLHAKTVNKSR